MSSLVPHLKNLFTSCLSVLTSSSLIPDIIESPTMAAVPFGHFLSVTLLLILAELIHSFDLFLCDRSFWSACSSYFLRFKKFVCFSFRISCNCASKILTFAKTNLSGSLAKSSGWLARYITRKIVRDRKVTRLGQDF